MQQDSLQLPPDSIANHQSSPLPFTILSHYVILLVYRSPYAKFISTESNSRLREIITPSKEAEYRL